MEMTRQKLVKLKKENGFKITWQVNIKRVKFLDVVLDLTERNHLPFRKPNDGIPQYVHRLSNSPFLSGPVLLRTRGLDLVQQTESLSWDHLCQSFSPTSLPTKRLIYPMKILRVF